MKYISNHSNAYYILSAPSMDIVGLIYGISLLYSARLVSYHLIDSRFTCLLVSYAQIQHKGTVLLCCNVQSQHKQTAEQKWHKSNAGTAQENRPLVLYELYTMKIRHLQRARSLLS